MYVKVKIINRKVYEINIMFNIKVNNVIYVANIKRANRIDET
jgi:hypothetical protein